MDIQILVKGKLPEVTYFGKCSNCGCEVSAAFEDHNDSEWAPSRHKNAVIEVDCPTKNCGYNIRCRQPRTIKKINK